MPGYFSAVTYRITGSAAVAQTLFTLENTGSNSIYVRRLNASIDASAVLTAVMPTIRCSRTAALPTGGYILSKSQFDTNNSSSGVIARGASTSDVGAASAITATPSLDLSWAQYGVRTPSQVGQILGNDTDILPSLVDTQNYVLKQNQAIVVFVSASATDRKSVV